MQSGGKFSMDKKRRGEAFDLAHMASLGASDILFTESRYTNFGINTAKSAGVLLFSEPRDLLAALSPLLL